MQQGQRAAALNSDMAAYFNRAGLPSQQETLGSIVVEILRSGLNLNRKTICMRLLARVDATSCPKEEEHLQTLIGLLFRM